MHARDELLHRERLGEVIVGAGHEPINTIVNFGFGREQDDWRHVTGSAHLAQHVDAALPGHHDIEDNQVEHLTCQHFGSLDPVVARRYLIPLVLQHDADRSAQVNRIFSIQNLQYHVVSSK